MRKQEKTIKKKIEQLTGINDIFYRSRKKENFMARVAFCKLVREYSSLNTSQIGECMGLSHCSSIYMTSQFEPLLQFEPMFKNLWMQLMSWYLSNPLEDYIKPEIKEEEIKPLFKEQRVYDIISELEDFSRLEDVLTKLQTIIKATNQMSRVTHQIK